MSALALLKRLGDVGVTITVVDGNLDLVAPKGALTPELRAELTLAKLEVISILDPAFDPVAHHIELCSFLQRTVRTPEGPGKLWQVFHDRVGVVLDGLPSRVTFYEPRDVSVRGSE